MQQRWKHSRMLPYNHTDVYANFHLANPWPRGTLAVLVNERCSGPQGSLDYQLRTSNRRSAQELIKIEGPIFNFTNSILQFYFIEAYPQQERRECYGMVSMCNEGLWVLMPLFARQKK